MARISALLLIAFVAAPAASGGEGLLARLVAADADTRAAARAEWDALDDDGRFRVAYAGLRSEVPARAAFAARHLDPWRIGLEDLRLRGRLVAAQAAEFFLPGRDADGWLIPGLGSPDLPALWTGFSKLRIEDPDAYFGDGKSRSRSQDFRQTHREMLPEQIPLLVDLLGKAADPTVCRELRWMLSWASEFTDRYREEVAGAMLRALARIRREEPPALEGKAAFRALATAAWREEADPEVPNRAWILRWARELDMTAEDVPFLLRVARQREHRSAAGWAIDALAGIDDPRAKTFVLEAAGSEDWFLAERGAIALARQGKPERFLAMLRRAPEEHFLAALAVAPAAAAEVWSPEWDDDGWSLEPSDRIELRATKGLDVRPEAYGPILRRLLEAESLPVPALGWIEDHPELFTAGTLAGLVRKITHRPPPADIEDVGTLEGWLEPMAHLEVRAPDALSDLLDWFAGSPDGTLRDEALLLLARTGDRRRIDETLAGLDRLLESDRAFSPGEAGAALGGLDDPRIVEALAERAKVEDRARAYPAVLGLLVRHGMPDRVAGFDADALDADAWEAVRAAALAGDVAAALLALDDAGAFRAEEIAWFGESRDPRLIARLRREREEHTGRYWPATAGLALAGDAAAKAELSGFLDDVRTAMLDPMEEVLVVAMAADPANVEREISFLESNCCRGFFAIAYLGQRFPTLDWAYEMNLFPETAARVRAWYERHRGHFRWSRIARGLVPAN